MAEDEAPAQQDLISRDVLTDRINQKTRSFEAERAGWTAERALFESSVAKLRAELDATTSARAELDTIRAELDATKRAAAFSHASIGDETIQAAIQGIYGTVAAEDRPEGGFVEWLADGAYQNPLVAAHLPRRGEDGQPAPAAPTAAPQTAAAGSWNTSARSAVAPPVTGNPRDELDAFRRETKGLTHEQRRDWIAQRRLMSSSKP